MSAICARVAELFFTLCGILVLTFLLMHALPGDPAELYAGEEATQDDIEGVRRRLGLDRPLLVQFAGYVARLCAGDLGVSFRSKRPVAREIAARWPLTLQLALLASAFAAAVGLPLGVLAAAYPDRLPARAVDHAGVAILATPVYWLGLLLILGFSLHWPHLPPGGSGDLKHLVLPALTLGLHTAAATARILKATLLDVLGSPYILTALAKGASFSRALWRHAVPNALVPMITFLAMETGRALGGAVLTESVFALNGVGRYLVTSIVFRDHPAVLGSVLAIAFGVTLANFVADLVVYALDPRSRAA